MTGRSGCAPTAVFALSCVFNLYLSTWICQAPNLGLNNTQLHIHGVTYCTFTPERFLVGLSEQIQVHWSSWGWSALLKCTPAIVEKEKSATDFLSLLRFSSLDKNWEAPFNLTFKLIISSIKAVQLFIRHWKQTIRNIIDIFLKFVMFLFGVF